ncbi:MAG: UDP-N-acetylmuramoyl-tripeptide--D-alanyl-D-alanine ligase [Gemmatimonadota bacterium]
MSFWTSRRVSQALASHLLGARPGDDTNYSGISTDSRTVGEGQLFVALVGDRFDGHQFVVQAAAAGARAAVVSRPAAPGNAPSIPVFRVQDTTLALGALATYRRRAWNGGVVAVAGSNGKTSTRALITAALSTRLDVHATSGNLNNHIGVPLTVLGIPDNADVAVVEIGTNHPGEVATLRDIALPDISVLTSIGEEHLEGLGSLGGVLREESAVFSGARIAIVPADITAAIEIARSAGATVIDVGLTAGLVRPTSWGLDGDGLGRFVLDGTRFTLALPGEHNIRNALLAAAVARACGVADEDAARGMRSLPPLPMRSELERLGDLLLLNDAYNSNPASAREALTLLDSIGGERPRIAVLATMLELGAQEGPLHDDIARRALEGRATTIVGIGRFAESLSRIGAGEARIITGADADDVWPALRERIEPRSLILLKGSRGTRLERLAAKLREYAGAARSPDSPNH